MYPHCPFPLSCSEPRAPAQLPLLWQQSTERAAAPRAAFHPGTKAEAARQHAQPRGHSGDNYQSLGFTLLLSSHFTHTVFLTARMSHSWPKLKATAYSWTFLSETNGHGYKPYISTFILLPTPLRLPIYCNYSYYKLFWGFFFAMCTFCCLLRSNGKSTEIRLSSSWKGPTALAEHHPAAAVSLST